MVAKSKFRSHETVEIPGNLASFLGVVEYGLWTVLSPCHDLNLLTLSCRKEIICFQQLKYTYKYDNYNTMVRFIYLFFYLTELNNAILDVPYIPER